MNHEDITLLITTRTGLRYFAVTHPEAGLVFSDRLQANSKAAIVECFKHNRDAILAGERVSYSLGSWVQRIENND
jgi:hypothetical protein